MRKNIFENVVDEGENADNQLFLILPKVFYTTENIIGTAYNILSVNANTCNLLLE